MKFAEFVFFVCAIAVGVAAGGVILIKGPSVFDAVQFSEIVQKYTWQVEHWIEQRRCRANGVANFTKKNTYPVLSNGRPADEVIELMCESAPDVYDGTN